MAPHQISSSERQLKIFPSKPPRGTNRETTLHVPHVRRQDTTMKAGEKDVRAVNVVISPVESNVCRKSKSNFHMRSLEQALVARTIMHSGTQERKAIEIDFTTRLSKSGELGITRDPYMFCGDYIASSKFKDTLAMPQPRARDPKPWRARSTTPTTKAADMAQKSGYASARTALDSRMQRQNDGPALPPIKVRNRSCEFQGADPKSPLWGASSPHLSIGAQDTGHKTPSNKGVVSPSFLAMHQNVSAAVEFYARSHRTSSANGAAQESPRPKQARESATRTDHAETSFRETLDVLAGNRSKTPTEGNSPYAQGSLVRIKEMTLSKSGPLLLWPSRNLYDAGAVLGSIEVPGPKLSSPGVAADPPESPGSQNSEGSIGKDSASSTGDSRSNEPLSTTEETDSVGSSAECEPATQPLESRDEGEITQPPTPTPALTKGMSRRQNRSPSLCFASRGAEHHAHVAAEEAAEEWAALSQESQGSNQIRVDVEVVDWQKIAKEGKEPAGPILFSKKHLEAAAEGRGGSEGSGDRQRRKGALEDDADGTSCGLGKGKMEEMKIVDSLNVSRQQSLAGTEDGLPIEYQLEESVTNDIGERHQVAKSFEMARLHRRIGSRESSHIPRMHDALKEIPAADNNNTATAPGTPRGAHVKYTSLSHSGSLMSRSDSLSIASSCATPRSYGHVRSVSLDPGVISESGVVNTTFLETATFSLPPPQYYDSTGSGRKKLTTPRRKIQRKWYSMFVCGGATF